MKVYLINMPFFEQEYTKFSEKWEYIEDEYLGIGIVQKILEDEGCEVFVNKHNCISAMIQTVWETDPDCVMISIMQTSAGLTYKFVTKLRESGWNKNIFIGGWFVKMAWREILKKGWPIDYACYCDAEEVLKEWLSDSGKCIAGIATTENYDFHDKSGVEIVRNKNVWPENYSFSSRIDGRNTYCIETSRGCPHSRCTFCSQSCGNMIQNKWRPLPTNLIRKQIIELHEKYGACRFSTADDDLLGFESQAEARAKELHELFQSLPFRAAFSASISVRSAANGEILDWLQDAGAEQLCLGFESADENQLKRYGKQQVLEENYAAAREIRKRQIPVLPGLITFDPFATRETVRKNLNFLFDELEHYDLGKLTKRLHLLTGTPIIKMVERAGLLTGDYLYYDYRFQDEDAAKLFDSFNRYTNKVKECQKEANNHKLQHDKDIGIHHRRVAEKILSGEEWEGFAQEEISKMMSEVKIKNL